MLKIDLTDKENKKWLHPTGKPVKNTQKTTENRLTTEVSNQISISDYPDLYKDIDIDTKNLGCIMINTEMIPVAQYIKDGQDDIYSEGNHSGLVGEEKPHATLLFGLLENGNTWKDKVDQVLEDWELPTVTIEEVTHFELEDSNVIIGLLKKTPELIDGHERLTLLPHVSTHSEYLPHISLAYIKKDVDIDKWVKSLARKYNGQKVATKGINYGDLPEDTPKKKTNNDSTEARLSHDCSQHEYEANSTLDKAKNALEPAIQHNVALQESDLYTSAQGIQSEMANLIILAIRNGNYQEASELLTDAEARELNKKLKLLLAAYYLTLMPIYGKQLMDVRLGEYGTQGIFAMTDQIERYVDESSQAAADSHIKTIRNDLINAATKAQAKVDEDAVIQAVKWSVEARETKYLPKLPTNPNLEDITKAVKSGAFKGDQALYKRAREFSREGGGLDEMTRAIQKEYQNISKNRARTIARHETNRVFNMAQYQADLQFLQENGWLQKGYKRLRSRTGDPCPVCESLINETTANPIPFEQNFADLGATLNANYKKKDGKTAVQTIPISYEAIKAGNVHVNCVLPETVIDTDSATNLTKAYYSGDIINILTSDSRRVRVTPNHIMLTSRGWVAAKDLTEADSVTVNLQGVESVTKGPDNHNSPATIEQQFALFLEANNGVSLNVPATSENFKGDSISVEGEINIIPINSKLRSKLDTQSFKSLTKNSFISTLPLSGVSLIEPSNLLSVFTALGLISDGIVSSQSSLLSLFESGVSKSDVISFSSASNYDARISKSIDNSPSINFELLREAVDRLSGSIKFDKVVSVDVGSYSGHVYDVSSVSSLYSANSIITSNCRCEYVLLIKRADGTFQNALEGKHLNYSPSQPRDSDGKWSDGGSGGGFKDYKNPNFYAMEEVYGKQAVDNDMYTKEEQMAINGYGYSDYKTINPMMRGKEPMTGTYFPKAIETIKNAPKQALKRDTYLYRGGRMNKTLGIGDTVSDKAFVSTSFAKSVAVDFAEQQGTGKNKYLFQIAAKKGTKGIYIGQDETEWLLDDGSSFKVNSMSQPNDRGVITVGVDYGE